MTKKYHREKCQHVDVWGETVDPFGRCILCNEQLYDVKITRRDDKD